MSPGSATLFPSQTTSQLASPADFFFFFHPRRYFFLFSPMRILVPGYKLYISKYKFLHAYECTFALGGISIPCSLFTSHFSLAFKCEPSVTRVSNCPSVLVVITNFKAVTYITRGSTVSLNLNRKKNLNNRKNSQGKRMICSLRTNFIVNQLATLTCVSLSLIQHIKLDSSNN